MRLACLALAAALSGCLSSWGIGESDIGPAFGELHVERVDVEARHDLLAQRVGASVDGTLDARDAQNVRVEAFLVAGDCPKTPASAPASWLDREHLQLGNVTGRADLAFALDLEAESLEALHHVIVVPSAGNVIGPIFGTCETLAPIPA